MEDTHPVVVTAVALVEAAIVAVEGTVAVPEHTAVEAVFESFDKLST